MSVTNSPKDLFYEVRRMHAHLYDDPPDASDKPFLEKTDDLLQHMALDMGVSADAVEGAKCYVLAARLAAVETALFGDTRVVVEDDVSLARVIGEAKRVRKRLTTPTCSLQ